MLLDPDVGDVELRARLLSTVPETQLREDQSDLVNWTRGDRPAAGLSQFAAPFLGQDEVRRRTGRLDERWGSPPGCRGCSVYHKCAYTGS